VSTASDAYLCVADKATGFKFDETSGQWNGVNFNVDSSKYLVRRVLPENEPYSKWEVKQVGKVSIMVFCDNNFNISGVLLCEDLYHHFLMNNESLKYQYTYKSGYMSDSPGDTPFIEIGKCSPM
jgi:hypothetical protein